MEIVDFFCKYVADIKYNILFVVWRILRLDKDKEDMLEFLTYLVWMYFGRWDENTHL